MDRTHAWRLVRRLAPFAALSPLLWACNNRPIQEPATVPVQETDHYFEQSTRKELDILFVIDKSGSMEQEQASLGAEFPTFMTVLRNIEGGMPSLHVGIVTTDLGGGAFAPPSCERPGGDNAILQNTEHTESPDVRPMCERAQLRNPDDRFIRASQDGSENNYTCSQSGDCLADLFACLGKIGPVGCGFEHQLEAMKRSLAGHLEGNEYIHDQTLNQGFIRPNAYLGVVFITDEDDCSAPDSSLLFDPSQRSLGDPLGPLTSYRCFEFGVMCSGQQPPRSQGPLQGCEPGSANPDPNQQLIPVNDYIEFLRNFPGKAGRTYVAAIAGPPGDQVNVTVDDHGFPRLAPTCTSVQGEADPAVRMKAFVDGFGQNGTFRSICAASMQDALQAIARAMVRLISSGCIRGLLKDTRPDVAGIQPECNVNDVAGRGGPSEEHGPPIPECDRDASGYVTQPWNGQPDKVLYFRSSREADPEAPCWHLDADSEACAPDQFRGAGYAVRVARGFDATGEANPPPAPFSESVVRCLMTSPCKPRIDPARGNCGCAPTGPGEVPGTVCCPSGQYCNGDVGQCQPCTAAGGPECTQCQ